MLPKINRTLGLYWISGLGIVLLFLVRCLVPPATERSDWLQYLSVGVLFPILILLVYRLKNFSLYKYLHTAFALVFLLWVFYFHTSLWLLLIALVSGFIMLPLGSKAYFEKLLLFVVSSLLVSSLYWWKTSGWFTHYEYLSVFPLLVLLCSFVFVCLAMTDETPGEARYKFLSYGSAFFVFLLCSVRHYNLDWSAVHHWGVYVGPAQLLRQGAWLLWSVPSQYGFLSAAAIAIMPFKSCWQSLYVLGILTTALTAGMMFHCFYARKAGLVNFIFSLGLSICALFLFAGMVPLLEGTFKYPSVGPYRFFWLYLMLFFLFIRYSKPGFIGTRTERLGAHLVWLFGLYWSVESAFYVSAVWFSFLLADSVLTAGSIKPALKKIALSLGLLISSLLVLMLFYLLRLKHFPDFVCYYESALSFIRGFGSLLIDIRGGAGLLLFVLFLFAWVLSHCFSDFRKYANEISLLMAVVFGLWSSVSYFISRSHENNVSNLIPIVVFSLGILIFVCSKKIPDLAQLLQWMLIPFFTTIFFLTLGNKPQLYLYLVQLKQGYTSDFEHFLPKAEPSLVQAIEKAGIQETDPVAYYDNLCLLNWKEGQHNQMKNFWLPTNPLTAMNPISAERAAVYFDRFREEFPDPGWLIQTKTYKLNDLFAWKYFQKNLSEHYELLPEGYENQDWKISRYGRRK